MAQSYRQFKKELQMKKEQEMMFKELESAKKRLEKKNAEYIEKAREGLKNGNETQYRAYSSLIKNSLVNIAQIQDMIVNITIARDMQEMQSLNKKFVKSVDNIMKNVYKTCKSINVSNSEKTFTKALFLSNETSNQLRQTLSTNNLNFANSVDAVSDMSDSDIKDLLSVDTEMGDTSLDDMLSSLESELMGGAKESPSQKVAIGPALSPKAEPKHSEPKPESKPEVKPEAKAEAKPEAKPEEKHNNTTLRPDAIPSRFDPKAPKEEKPLDPEEAVLEGVVEGGGEFKFNWDNLPSIVFDDIAGLEQVKETVRVKVLLPLKNPDAFQGYEKKNGGGVCLFGPPGTGKTMIAAAIANEIGAKFCSVKPSDLLNQGVGQTEKAVRALFAEARRFDCAVIYFDEMDSISPKNTKSSVSRQLRSEFLAQLQGVESYGKDKGNILFLVCATNKPWDIDSAFLRPGRFGTKIYVGLPDAPAREYMIKKRLHKIELKGVVDIKDDIDLDEVVERTNGFNGSDITNLLDRIEELSIIRGINQGDKTICKADFDQALEEIHSSVQNDDIIKLKEWREENNC